MLGYTREDEGHEAAETEEVTTTTGGGMMQEGRVDVFEEHIRALGDVCEGLTGRRMAVELAVLVLVRHGGLRAPSAQVLWMDPGLNAHPWADALNLSAVAHCACGAGRNIVADGHPVRKRLHALHDGKHPPMTARAAMHLQPRSPAVPSTYLTYGKYAVAAHARGSRVSSSVDRFGAWCRKTLLWNRVMANRVTDCDPTQEVNNPMQYSVWRWRTDSWLTEARFLLHADRDQIRELIARAHGTKPIRIEGDDYTSRAEWVRVYYNSLRDKPLEDWPRAAPPTPALE